MISCLSSKWLHRLALLIVVICTMVACSGGGGEATAMTDPGGGGIDGTGRTGGAGDGTVTGFGSVIFTGSKFKTDTDTVFTLDGTPVVEPDLREGMVASYLIGEDADPLLVSGTAQRIDARSVVKGLVTSIAPLQILGQTVIESQDTLYFGGPIGATDAATVYGYPGSNNVLLATRIEKNSPVLGNALAEWKVVGRVTAATPTLLQLGDLSIDINGVAVDDCGGGPALGDLVEVLAGPNVVPGFTLLQLVTSVRCVAFAVPLPDEPVTPLLPAEHEGIVSGYLAGTGDTDLLVGGQVVTLDFGGSTPTQFSSGSIEDLVDGARIEVEGVLDTGTAILTASQILFRSSRVEILAPADPADIDLPSHSFKVLDVDVVVTAATSDEVGILTGGLAVTTQLSIHGRVDGNRIIADEIRDEGAPKLDEIKFQGPLSNPTPNASFHLLGVQVTVDGGTQFFGAEGQVLPTAAAFFSTVLPGNLVEVEGELPTGIGGALLADDVTIEN